MSEAQVRSGETSLLALSAGSAPTVYLTDLNGRALAALPVNFADGRGTVELPADLEPGSYLVFAAESGQSADRMALEVLQPAPVILFADAPADYTEFWHVTATVNQSGTLILSDESLTELGRMRAEPDTDNALYPDSVPGAGTWTLILRLMADDGSLSDAYLLDLTVPEPEPPHRARDVNITTAQHRASHGGDPYPGTSGVTDIYGFNMYTGTMHKHIRNITETDKGIIEFDFLANPDPTGIQTMPSHNRKGKAFSLSGIAIGNQTSWRGVLIVRDGDTFRKVLSR